MRKNIPCNYFGSNDFLFFNYGKIAQLEQLLDKPILDVIRGEATVKFVVIGYFVGLQQCHPNATPEWYMEEIDRVSEEKDLSMEDLAKPILKALLASGFLGSKVAKRVTAEMGKNE